MSRPPTTAIGSSTTPTEPGRLKLQAPSGSDFANDLKSALFPILQLGVAVVTGVVKGTLRSLLTDPVQAIAKGLPGTAKDAITAIKAIKEAVGEKDPPERRAWQLVRNSLVQSVANVIDDQRSAFPKTQGQLLVMEFALQELPVDAAEITPAFFNSPRTLLGKLPIFDQIASHMSSIFKIDSAKTTEFLMRQLESQFDLSVWAEYHANKDYYQPVFDLIYSPLAGPAKWLAALEEHSARNRVSNQNSVMGSEFSLAQIYITLRAANWVRGKKAEEKGHFLVTSSSQYLQNWIHNRDTLFTHSMIFVSGGPGTGKSSLAFSTLAEVADDKRVVPILFRLLEFKWDESGLEAALEQYIARHYPYLPDVPWAEGVKDIVAGKTILLMFDGLDELSKALGPRGQTQSKVLVTSLKEFLDQRNPKASLQNTVLKAVVLGRTAAVQELYQGRMERHDTRELVLLGLQANPGKEHSGEQFADPEILLAIDQRQEWWKKYSELTSGPSEFPEIFDQPGIAELSREPLTLFLLVSAGYHKKDPGLISTRPSISQIYRDILYGLYTRDIERQTHAGQVELSFSEFFRALQVIGFAAWFTTERSTTRKQLVTVLSEFLVQDVPIFERFEKDIEEGAMKLLLAAHVRLKKQNEASEDAAYEFSHKTFGEFLAAECLWRQLSQLSGRFIRRELSLTKTAQDLADLISSSDLSPDFARFLRSTVSICGEACHVHGDKCRELSHDAHVLRFHDEFLIHMLSVELSEGLPISSNRKKYSELVQEHQNAERALIVLRSSVTGALTAKGKKQFRTPLPLGITDTPRSRSLNLIRRGGLVSCVSSDDHDFQAFHLYLSYSTISGARYSRISQSSFASVEFRDFADQHVRWFRTIFDECTFSGVTLGRKDNDHSFFGRITEVWFRSCAFERVKFDRIEFERVNFVDCTFDDVTMNEHACPLSSGSGGMN